MKKNFYTLTLEENEGNYRVLNAEKLQPINQHRSVFRRVNSRNLARQIKRGKLVIS